MSKTNEKLRHDRRRFLTTAVAAGGVATAASVAGLAGAREHVDETRAQPDSTSRGYHETAHIREYYRKARF